MLRRLHGAAHEEVDDRRMRRGQYFPAWATPLDFVEIAFEAEVVKALTCLFPDYWCGVFAGTFLLEGERRSADLALIHKSLSHWFVVEVELAGHSLDRHRCSPGTMLPLRRTGTNLRVKFAHRL